MGIMRLKSEANPKFVKESGDSQKKDFNYFQPLLVVL